MERHEETCERALPPSTSNGTKSSQSGVAQLPKGKGQAKQKAITASAPIASTPVIHPPYDPTTAMTLEGWQDYRRAHVHLRQPNLNVSRASSSESSGNTDQATTNERRREAEKEAFLQELRENPSLVDEVGTAREVYNVDPSQVSNPLLSIECLSHSDPSAAATGATGHPNLDTDSESILRGAVNARLR